MLLFATEGDHSKLAARLLLAMALRERYGLDTLPPMERGPYGKPFFSGHPHIHFNLSHSGPYALCALGDCPVGVDMESVRPRAPGLPAKVLTAEEYAWYRENGADWPAFYTLWTRKESWCKREGRSVLHPRTVTPPLPGEADGTLTVTGLSGSGWRAAVCMEGHPEALRWIAL